MGLHSLNTCYMRTQAEEWILSYISPRKFSGHPYTHSSRPSLETHALGSCRSGSCTLRDAWEPEQSSKVKHILREPGLEKQEGEGLCVLWASRAAWFWGMEGQEPNNTEKCREKGWATQWNDAECLWSLTSQQARSPCSGTPHTPAEQLGSWGQNRDGRLWGTLEPCVALQDGVQVPASVWYIENFWEFGG